MKDNEIALSPAVGWQLQGIPAYGAITLELQYLTHAMQPDAQSHQSPAFLLQTAQARELAQRILALCEKVESAPNPTASVPKH